MSDTTHEPTEAPEPEEALAWAYTGNLNSRHHIAVIEPFQVSALCGVNIMGMIEIRPITLNVCPKCRREARKLGADPAKVGIE